MRRNIRNFFSLFLVFAILLFSIYLPFGTGRVYGQEAPEAKGAAGAAPADYPSGRPLMGYPGMESVPATPQDIEILKTLGENTVQASILPALNSSKTFYAIDFSVTSSAIYMPVNADLKRIGAHSYIYVQQSVTSVSAIMLDNIVMEFEKIYEKDVEAFGNTPDIDKDKRISILLMDINDNIGDGSYIAGYFSAINELPAVNYPGRSNQCEIFYMDVDEGLPDTPQKMNDFYGTLAHEFQHMIQYGVYLDNYTLANVHEELWMNEALSQLAIFLNGYGHPIVDIECYLADWEPGNSGLLDFHNDIAEYGASYLFALYLYEKFGSSFIKNLAQNPLSGVEGLDDQLAKDNKNRNFEEIFEKLQIAVAVDNSSGLGDYSFSSINISNIRENPKYLSPSAIMFKSLSSLSNQYTTKVTCIPSTWGGSYRSNGALIDGSRTATSGAVNLKLDSSTGDYYIIKPTDGTPATTYSAFALADKIIEKINPDTVNGNTIKLSNDQIALLLYIAKKTPISTDVTITEVAAPAEDTVPSTPAALRYTTAYNVVSLSWKPSSYTKGIKGYNIYRNSVIINTSASGMTNYTDFTVSPSSIYTYEVSAIGQDNVESSKSNPVTVNTPATPDIIPPAAPVLTYVSTQQLTSTSAGITFRLTDTINDTSSAISRYDIITLLDGMESRLYYCDETDLDWNIEIDGLQLNQIYNLYAYAVDKAGNYSPKSAVIKVKAGTGLATLSYPTKPTNLTGSAIGDHRVTISWNASTAASGILHYNIFRDGVFLTTTASISYTDNGLTDATTYKYTVEAVGNDANRLNSDLSDALSITTLNDVTPPSAIISYSDPDGKVKQGDVLTITATFSEPMKVSPQPQISITGASTQSALAMTRVNSTTYTYSHTVGSGNGSAAVSLSVGQDLGGNVLSPTPTSGGAFTVDNIAPTATITYSDADGFVKAGTSLTITADFDEPVADSPVPRIAITGANTVAAINMTKVSSTQYTYSYTVGSGNGPATVSLSTGRDIVGNVVVSTPTSGASFTVDNIAPTAFISYSDTDRIVNVGTSLTITANFNEDMADSPAPRIAISGANTTPATIMTKQDVRTYTYTYTVASGNGTATVALSSGMDKAGNIIVSTPTSGGSFTVDNTNPTVSITYSDSDRIVKQGDSLVITANFNKDMADSPVPQITISGADTQSAIAMTKVNPRTYNYTHTVGSGNGTATISITSAQDTSGNNVISTPTSGASFTVDNLDPTASISYSDTDGIVKGGSSLTVTATFSEAVSNTTIPAISISGAGINVVTQAMNRSDATHYTYTLNTGTGNGTATVTLSNSYDLVGHSVTPAAVSTFTLDSVNPTVAISYSDTDKTVKSGDALTITADFSESMADSPAPRIVMDAVGGMSAIDAAMTKSSATTYTYLYNTGSGNGVRNIKITTGTDIAGNTVTATPTTGASFTVDNTAPSVSISYSDSDKLVKQGDSLTLTAVFSEVIADSPAPTIAISGANTVSAIAMSKTDSTHYTYTYTVGSGNGTANVVIGSGRDLAGNIVVGTPTSGASFTIDSIAPIAAISFSDTDGIVKNGNTLIMTATFSEPMSVTTPPTISLSGAGINTTNNMTKTDATHFTYSYNVGSGDGVVNVTLGGTDIAGNTAVATPTSGASFTLDNTAPVNITAAKGTETDSTVPISTKINENGITYFVCLADGASAPSSIQVKQGQTSTGSAVAINLKGIITATANTTASAIIKGLKGATPFDIYVVSEDLVGNLQATPVKIDALTLPDTTPPSFASTYPKQLSVSDTSVTIAVKTDEYGKAYYVLLGNNAASPTAIQVQTGLNASGAAFATKGNIDLVGDTEGSFTISGLHSSTSYDVYVIAEDVSDQLQATPVKIDVTTNATPVPGSGSGGSGGSVPPPAAPPATTTPSAITPGEPVKLNSEKPEIEINSNDINKAFEQTRQDNNGNKKVYVTFDNIPGVNAYTATIPADQVAAGKGDKKIEIQTAIGNIEIPSNMFQNGEVAGASKVGITVGTADKSKLSEDILKSIGSRPVIELGVTLNGKPYSWKSDNVTVAVTVNYTPTAAELKDPEHITVWYIDGSGKAVSVSNGRYDPVTRKVTFTTDHFSTYAIVYVQKTFKDITDSWAKNEIEVMASKGVINGTSDTTFSPNAQITRADFITLLVRTLGLKAKFTSYFSDIQKTDHYYEAVGIAKKLGITNGTGNNKFNPKESISRQDMAALTLRAMQVAGKISKNIILKQTLKYNDAPSIAPYAYESVATLIERKIIEKKGLEFKPKEFITRAEMADVIYNIYNN